MKTTLKLGLPVLLAQLGLLAQLQTQAASTTAPATIVGIVAQDDNLKAISYSNLPAHGTYWEVLPGGLTAPLPEPLFDPSLPIYSMASGIYLVDGTRGAIVVNPRQSAGLSQSAAMTSAANTEATKVANLISQVQKASANSATLASSATVLSASGTSGGTLSPNGQQQPQSGVPYLTIAPGTNQFLITVYNDTTQGLYFLQSTPVLGDTNYPWSTIASGTNGQTNFIISAGPYNDSFFRVLMSSNAPGSGIAVFIDSPANGATVQ